VSSAPACSCPPVSTISNNTSVLAVLGSLWAVQKPMMWLVWALWPVAAGAVVAAGGAVDDVVVVAAGVAVAASRGSLGLSCTILGSLGALMCPLRLSWALLVLS
jgi:hypothetical protein